MLSSGLPPSPEDVLSRVEWEVVRILDGLLQGNYRTLFYGNGIDFADLREYQPGDDVRHIDWNVTARLNSPHVRDFVEDRELSVWFLIDRSASMTFGRLDRPKNHVLVELVTSLARMFTRSGNRVGAIMYDNAVEKIITPASGRNQVLRLAFDLLDEPVASGRFTDLGGLITIGANVIKRRSLVFLMSDFITAPGWDTSLIELSRRNEVIGIRLQDPLETALPAAGMMVVQDVETGEQLYVDTADPEFRRRLSDLLSARDDDLHEAAVRAGIDLHTISTTDDLVSSVIAMARSRRLRRYS